MKIESKVKKNTLVVKIEGRIDMDTSPELEKYIEGKLEGVEAVELDFKKVGYISSAGLRVLLKISKAFDGSRQAVTITHVDPTVRSVFELTGFDEMFVLK